MISGGWGCPPGDPIWFPKAPHGAFQSGHDLRRVSHVFQPESTKARRAVALRLIWVSPLMPGTILTGVARQTATRGC